MPPSAIDPDLFPDFGEFLTYAASVKSHTALNKGIVNVPTPAQYANMKLVYENVYVPVCEHFGKLPVTSFFRSPKLNKAVGGVPNSQHMAGQAIDIDCDLITSPTNRELFAWIKDNLNFDQLLFEHPDSHGNPGWVHISWVSVEANRMDVRTIV